MLKTIAIINELIAEAFGFIFVFCTDLKDKKKKSPDDNIRDKRKYI